MRLNWVGLGLITSKFRVLADLSKCFFPGWSHFSLSLDFFESVECLSFSFRSMSPADSPVAPSRQNQRGNSGEMELVRRQRQVPSLAKVLL